MTMAFLINGKTFDMSRVDVEMRVGQTELWEIQNPTDMDHPFHIHGTQFQVVEVERSGRISKPAYRAWKDTINVARGETVRIAVCQQLPGLRMYHCHILEHEDRHDGNLECGCLTIPRGGRRQESASLEPNHCETRSWVRVMSCAAVSPETGGR
jgi:hypothetical protein